MSHEPCTFDNNERSLEALRCYNCVKLGHIAHNYRSKRKVNATMARSSDDFAFVIRDEVLKTSATRWIVNSGALEQMTPYKCK